MKRPFKILTGTLLGAAIFTFAAGNPQCGTTLLRNRVQSRAAQAAARTAYTSVTDCAPEAYYDSAEVLTRKTSHFRIYYVLEGPHATTETFVDSLEKSLEAAWDFHIERRRAKKPVGANPTWHFQKSGEEDLFPVEVVDLSLMRNSAEFFGGFCTACMGVTFPPNESSPRATEILFDNDFAYPGVLSPSAQMPNSTCSYPAADHSISNSMTGADYRIDFGKALRVTAVHEFYHAIQAMYMDFFQYNSYWLEASATAAEELAAPEVNDYWAYLSPFFSTFGTPFHELSADYGLAVWGLYNAERIDSLLDLRLWERISKDPDAPFENIFAEELSSRGLNPDSAFLDFAERLFFSGKRSEFADSGLYFSADFPHWPLPPMHASSDRTLVLEPPSFDYYRITSDSIPDLSLFKGKAAVALYGQNQKTAFYSLDTISVSEILLQMNLSENAVLILSRLQDSVSARMESDSLPMRSYPNPWRGETPLCFAGLPKSKGFVEIRTRVGKLVKRYPYTGENLCIGAEDLKPNLAPGLYFFRAGAKNRMKPFLVIY